MKPPPARFRAIDALRGYAALSVLVFHLIYNSPQATLYAELLPAWVYSGSGYLRSGVATFFVISGFVIGYTTYSLGSRVRDGARFGLRRQIRLDPPYYATIALVLVMGAIETSFGFAARTFTLGEVLLNLVYLQDIVGAPAILAVAWTLCLEVQFYLVTVLVLLIAGAIAKDRPVLRVRITRMAILTSGMFSLLMPLLRLDAGPWFIGTWWMFCLGMCISWLVRRSISVRYMSAILAVSAAILLANALFAHSDPWGGEWFAWATAALIVTLTLTGALTRDHGAASQYFGKLSYSLYLVHLPLLTITMGALLKVTGSSTPAIVLALAVGAGISIGAAELLRRFVEKPAILWATLLKPKDAPRPQLELPQPH